MNPLNSLGQHTRGVKNVDPLHPLEEHTGGRASGFGESQIGCCTDQVRWTAAHPLALQAYEGVHVLPADTWSVPAPEGLLVDDRIAPPVAKVTAIYGCNVPTLRTIFLKHRPVHVSGGPGPVRSALQLDDDGEIDGFMAYSGQGFETRAVPQLRPDTGEQVFVSGDGTVNYHSLRHAATWASDKCNVDVFELPGCDHRGVSYDKRMLALLRGVLGLGDRAAAQAVSEKLQDQMDDAVNPHENWYDFTFIGMIAKTGMRVFSITRTHLNYMQLLALFSCAVVVVELIYGVSQDPDLLTNVPWAHIGIETDDRRIDIDIGILTFASTDTHLWNGTTHTCTYLECSKQTLVPNRSSVSKCGLGSVSASVDICEDCYGSGLVAYIVLASTCIIQLLLGWLHSLRLSPATDSRCRKFGTLCACCTVFGASIMFFSYWEYHCYSEIRGGFEEIAAGFPGTSKVTYRLGMGSALLLGSGLLALLGVFVMNLLTPVPEVYRDFIEPESKEVHSNSGSSSRDDARIDSILASLAKKGHSSWNKQFHLTNDKDGVVAERIKELQGHEMNIAVPFDDLDPLWKDMQIKAQGTYLKQLKPLVDRTTHLLSISYEELVSVVAEKIHDVWMTNNSYRKDKGDDLHLFVPFCGLPRKNQENDENFARLTIPLLWNRELVSMHES